MNKIQKVSLAFSIILLVAGGGLFVTLKYLSSAHRDTPLVYSNSAMLLELWDAYKANNIEVGSGRTLDRSQNNITTSEGQSYTMLRSVWMDDKATFDSTWTFSKNNMQRQDDYLLSWEFGKHADGSYGILTESGGQNTASDADTDTALSLLMAYSRWNDPAYLYQAKQMITSIWDKEVISVQGKPVLAANDIERNSPTTIVVNPSYFSPYSYKLFAKVDSQHDWYGLASNSYSILTDLSTSKLDKISSDGLEPNWIEIDRTNGAYAPAASPNLDTNYGYDAFRTPWRLALDFKWFKDPRDTALLSRYTFLAKTYQATGSLKAVYGHDGKVVGDYESPAMYGAAMGYFVTINPSLATKLYSQKLASLYSPDIQNWKTQLSYYDDNWAWFGIALYQNALPNLAEINN